MDVETSEINERLAGSYRIERELGRGGMGIVFLARDLMLDRPVAIKVLPESLAAKSELRERFLREARTAAQLSHPHIVPIYRADEAGGHAYFVMGFIDGESLAERVQARGPLPVDEGVRYLREVAWALAYAHARGVVHRDVKPENIMIERGSGRSIVTDFGIAHAEHQSRLTMDGHVLGTAYYMSPEQVNGEALDGRSDLYALGVVGFYALSGRLPFEAQSTSAVLVAHVTRRPPALREYAPQVPESVAAVIDRCLSKNRDERFASGEELADALSKGVNAAAVEEARDGTRSARVLREGEAMAIWRRAAQLQAEAAQRLEQRARRSETLALPSGATPIDGFRLKEVEAAAVEAGISQHFVALAIAELPQAATATPQSLAGWQERAAARWFGSTEQSLAVSRVIRATPRRVLQAIGRVLPASPHNLVFQSQVGPHPLDGGVLVFDLPAMVDYPYPWVYTRYGVYARQLRVALRPLPHDSQATEVSLYVDLRRGLKLNLLASAGVTAGLGIGGGAAAAVVAVKALALAGAAIALPVLGGIAAVGAVSAVGFAAGYRFEVRKTREELDKALRAVENDVRSEEVFGAPLRAHEPPRARSTWDDAPSIGMGT